MRAVSLCQPYATAIVGYVARSGQVIEGPKRVENRGWRWPSTLRLPQVVAIHAGKQGWPDDVPRQLWPELPPFDELPRSAIVGLARFVACLPFDEVADRCGAPPSRWKDLVEASPWTTGPWCWVVDHAVPFETPIKIERGFQGLWGLGQVDANAERECAELARLTWGRDWDSWHDGSSSRGAVMIGPHR